MRVGFVGVIGAAALGFAVHSIATASVDPAANARANQAIVDGGGQTIRVAGALGTEVIDAGGDLAGEGLSTARDTAGATGLLTTPAAPSLPVQPSPTAEEEETAP